MAIIVNDFNNMCGSDEYDKMYATFEPIEYNDRGEAIYYKLKTNEPDEELKRLYYDRVKEIEQYRCDCKDEAMDLIKKYFYCLWD